MKDCEPCEDFSLGKVFCSQENSNEAVHYMASMDN